MTRPLRPGARITVSAPTVTTEPLRDQRGTVAFVSIGTVAVHMDLPVPDGLRCDARDAHTVIFWPDELTLDEEAAPCRAVA